MSIRIIEPGILTSVQDHGRRGLAAQGYRSCGAADLYAYQLGNAILGNEPGAASLECTLSGAAVRFTQDTLYAITGADVNATLDDVSVPCNAALWAPAGSELRLGFATRGLRIYLAVGGGITTAPVLGSRSTDLKCHLGGYAGRALEKGDELPVGYDVAQVSSLWGWIRARRLQQPITDPCVLEGPHPWIDDAGSRIPVLRAVAGPQESAFTAAGLDTFTHSIYTLSPDCDRMGCKLTGPAVEMVNGADILSDGIVTGSVQISANGQPIVMLADHQTTGGYAKVATVISADLPVLAQLRPGQQVAFAYVTPEEAVAAARERSAVLREIRGRLPL